MICKSMLACQLPLEAVVDVPLSILHYVCSETICYTPRTDTLPLAAPFQPLLAPGARRER